MRIPFIIDSDTGHVSLEKTNHVAKCRCGKVLATQGKDVIMAKAPFAVFHKNKVYVRCGVCKTFTVITQNVNKTEFVI